MSDLEENLEDLLLIKPCGEYHRKGKRHLKQTEKNYKSVKNTEFLQKIVSANDSTDKKTVSKMESSRTDGFNSGVMYSINKKNRFRDITDLLSQVPEDVDAEVVERNMMRMHSDRSITAIHTRRMEEDSADIVSTRRTSGIHGQAYSNFQPENRSSKRKVEKSEEKPVEATKPKVTYNMYKVNGFSNNVHNVPRQGNMTRHRGNKKIDADEEYYQYHRCIEDSVDIFYNPEEDGEPHRTEFTLSLGDLVVQEPRSRRKQRSECGSQFEIIDVPECVKSFSQVLNIANVLHSDGYTFRQLAGCFERVEEFNFEREIDKIRSDGRFEVKDLRPKKQYLVDATNYFNVWNPDNIKIMETTVIVVLSHIEQNRVNVLINSTIAENLSKHNLEFWKNVIAESASVWDAVQTIAAELAENSGIIERMRLYSSFYGFKTTSELIHSSEEWTNQLAKNVFPNRFNHATWTTASELLNTGSTVEWSTLCEMLRNSQQSVTFHPNNGDVCDLCHEPGYSLFRIKDDSRRVECSECLKGTFYKELSAGRLPINLQTDTGYEFDYLPTIVPLTIINLYMMASELVRRGDSILEKCQQCKAFLCFENIENNCFSCSCGYCWCSNCKKPPHWPMSCEEHEEWEKKWDLRYSLEHAQGTGTEVLMQVTCECKNAVFYVRTPEEKMRCPKCDLLLDTTSFINEHFYWECPWPPNLRKSVELGKLDIKDLTSITKHQPYAMVKTKISKIPNIKSSVIKLCKQARDARFDLEQRKVWIKKDRELVRENVLEERTIERLMSTVAYLVENVAGWMYETNHSDKGLGRTLEKMMDTRHALISVLEGGEDRKSLVQLIQNLESMKKSVIDTVEKILKDL